MISKTVLVFLVVYFLSKSSLAGTHENFFRKDYRYLEKVERFYKFHMTVHTFKDAKRICALEGASLFYPEDKVEADAVTEYWKNLYPSSTWVVVVALTDSKSEGNFETIDEIPVSDVYYKWALNEPNNLGPGDEDCVTFDKNGIMNDVRCDLKFRFICKKKEYTYIKAVDSYYKIHQKASTFAEAKRMCDLESASLFYPEDENEANAVIEFWNKTQPKQEWLIVGMSNLMTDVVFETVDGKLIYDVYENWLDGEPSDDDKHCIRLNRQGYIHDMPCTEKHRFICKRLLRPWNDDCNMANLDYTFNQKIGKCYKLHTSPLSWTEAYAVCRAEMSYLAVMNNTLEKDYLQKLAISNQKNSVAGPYQRGIYHVGIHNRFNEGWQTVTGQRINDASAWWGNYQPAADDDKKCGSMFYTGLLNNIDCDTKSFFICENDIEGVTISVKLNEINEENIR